MHLPLSDRFVPLNNELARGYDMLAPVCVYKKEELFNQLLAGLPITNSQKVAIFVKIIAGFFHKRLLYL
jgi:hypothetical protein